jgi:hypothetical protein
MGPEKFAENLNCDANLFLDAAQHSFERVMSVWLDLMGGNQSIILRFMLYFELERAHNIEIRHLREAHDERVIGGSLSFEARVD